MGGYRLVSIYVRYENRKGSHLGHNAWERERLVRSGAGKMLALPGAEKCLAHPQQINESCS